MLLHCSVDNTLAHRHHWVFGVLVAAVALSTAACAASRLGGLRGARPGAGFLRMLLSRHRALGSVIFHLGMLLTLAGAVVSSFTRFEGRIVVAEGETVPLRESSFRAFGKRGRFSDASAPFQVRLEKFRPQNKTRWGVPDYASDLAAVADGSVQRKATVRVNSPLVHRGVIFYQGTHGFSPRFMFAIRKSGKLFNKNVAMETDMDSDPVRYRGSFAVPGTEFTIDAEFFPDAVFEEGRLRSKSPVPKNPAASVAVRRGNTVVFSGPIGWGGPVEIEKGVCIGLGRPRYWSEFTVVKDRGVTLVFIGAWIATAGLCIRFLLLKRKRAG